MIYKDEREYINAHMKEFIFSDLIFYDDLSYDNPMYQDMLMYLQTKSIKQHLESIKHKQFTYNDLSFYEYLYLNILKIKIEISVVLNHNVMGDVSIKKIYRG